MSTVDKEPREIKKWRKKTRKNCFFSAAREEMEEKTKKSADCKMMFF